MHRKLATIICSLILLFTSLTPAALASAAGANLIANPSVETASGSLPASWSQGKWGTNTTTFTYQTAAGHTGTHSLAINMTKHTSGDAKWYFADMVVKPSTQYTYGEFYKSSVATEIDVQYTSTTGALSYAYLAAPAASASAWTASTATFTTPANVKTLTIFHAINKVGTLQTDDFSLAETNAITPTPPTVSFSAPASNASLSGMQTVSVTATDTIGVAGVQFQIDGSNFGAEDTVAPYSVSVDTTTLPNGSHVLGAIARNTSNLTTTATETVSVQNTAVTPPLVSITAPTNNAIVSGAQTVSANASDAKGVTSVQFKLDGNNIGAADTTAPYTTSWDTTTVTNGNHTLTAVATNTANLVTTSTPVTVNVQNTLAQPSNLIPNPSLETANGAAPASWLSSNWGTNTSTFSYVATAHSGSHAVRVDTTAYTNGAANWYYPDVTVTAGKMYQYTNWYESNVDTEVDAEVLMSDGTTSYYYLGTVLASTTWAQFKTTFSAPAGAKSMAIYQILAKKGYIVSDDYSLNEYTPVPFNRAIVSVTFDDGWTNQYQNAFPVIKQYSIPSTFYIISGELTDQPDYMTATQVKALQAAGNEIASHSVTHPDLTTLTATQLQNEMKNSQATLQATVGVPVTDFAYPFGAYNGNTIVVGKQYYQSQRSVNAGYNTRDNLDLTQLKIYEVDSNITQAQVKAWIDGAIADKSWLILVYHEIATTPTDPTDALYTTQPSDLSAEMAYLKSTGVALETVHQAINEVLPQL